MVWFSMLLDRYTIERVSQLVLRIRTLEPDGLILYAAGQVYYRQGYSAKPENKDSGTWLSDSLCWKDRYTIERVSQLALRIRTLKPDGLILYAAGQVY